MGFESFSSFMCKCNEGYYEYFPAIGYPFDDDTKTADSSNLNRHAHVRPNGFQWNSSTPIDRWSIPLDASVTPEVPPWGIARRPYMSNHTGMVAGFVRSTSGGDYYFLHADAIAKSVNVLEVFGPTTPLWGHIGDAGYGAIGSPAIDFSIWTYDDQGVTLRMSSPSALATIHNKWVGDLDDNPWPEDALIGVKPLPQSVSAYRYPRAATAYIKEYLADDWVLNNGTRYEKQFTATWAIAAGDLYWESDLPFVAPDYEFETGVLSGTIYGQSGFSPPAPTWEEANARRLIADLVHGLGTGTLDPSYNPNAFRGSGSVLIDEGSERPDYTNTFEPVRHNRAGEGVSSSYPTGRTRVPLFDAHFYDGPGIRITDIAGYRVAVYDKQLLWNQFNPNTAYWTTESYTDHFRVGDASVAVPEPEASTSTVIAQACIPYHPDYAIAYSERGAGEDQPRLVMLQPDGTEAWSVADAEAVVGTHFELGGANDRYLFASNTSRLATIVGDNLPDFTDNIGSETEWTTWAIALDGSRWNPLRHWSTSSGRYRTIPDGNPGERVGTSAIPLSPPDTWY